MTNRSKPQRWVTAYTLYHATDAVESAKRHAEAFAVVRAFQKIGRVLRAEPSKYTTAIDFKARR